MRSISHQMKAARFPVWPSRSGRCSLCYQYEVLVIDEAGYWVKFVVHQVPATADKSHGLDYTLTMHGPDGGRLVGFDNAHPVAGQGRGAAKDHKHRLRTVRPYDYTDAGTLLAAFWQEVESVMREKGVWT